MRLRWHACRPRYRCVLTIFLCTYSEVLVQGGMASRQMYACCAAGQPCLVQVKPDLCLWTQQVQCVLAAFQQQLC